MIIFFVCIFYFYFYCFKLLLFSMWPWLSVLLELPQQNIDRVSQGAETYFLTILGLDVQDQVLVEVVSDESSLWACTWSHSHCVLMWPFPSMWKGSDHWCPLVLKVKLFMLHLLDMTTLVSYSLGLHSPDEVLLCCSLVPPTPKISILLSIVAVPVYIPINM